MDLKKYSNDVYVPINKLLHLSTDFIDQITEYREKHKEIIVVTDLEFAFLVETTALIKKRYDSNVKIAKYFINSFKSTDFILEIAKLILQEKQLPINISKIIITKLLLAYQESGNDLTIITSYLTNNIMDLIISKTSSDMFHIYPILNNKDKTFITEYNQVNMSYSISDYVNLISCSYETARSALEKMEKLYLYKKEKKGKKFVYQPTIKLRELLREVK
jgi:hypothetical protein